MAIEIRSTVDLTQMLATFGALGEKLPETVRMAVSNSVQAMMAYLVKDRLRQSGPNTLQMRTGMAVKSIGGGVVSGADRVTGYFGSPLRYVRAHDQGFIGTVRVRAHERRLARRGKRSKLTVQVRAHEMRMNMRARQFFKKTLEVGAPGVEQRVIRALRILARTGNVPTFGDIEGGGA